MSVDWKYIYKRRGWTVETVFNSLDQKTWESFSLFHQSRGITCPPKNEFDKLLSPPTSKQTATKKPATKKKRAYTRKKRS